MFKKIFVFSFIWYLLLAANYLYADWVRQVIDSNGDVGSDTSIALDTNGYPNISYSDTTNSGLKYAKLTPIGWDIQTVESLTGGSEGSLALDSSNNPRIVYIANSSSNLKYSSWTSVGWSTTTIEGTYSCSYPALALDSNNYPHVIYNAWQPGPISVLRYSSYTFSGWSSNVVDSTAGYCSLAIDSNNYPHISYIDEINLALKYAKWTGVAWSTETVDSYSISGSSVYYYTSIALDSNDYPHITYLADKKKERKYAKWTPSGWSREVVDNYSISMSSAFIYGTISLDKNDYPHIAYQVDPPDEDPNLSWSLKYAKWNGVSWKIETVDPPDPLTSSDSCGSWNSITLGPYNKARRYASGNNYPHISYKGGGGLKYAKWNNIPVLSWTGEKNYTDDGLHPYTGYASKTTYVFRIKYTDIDNEPPKNGYPKLHITYYGDEIYGSPFTMGYVSGSYDTGAIYSYSTKLSVPGSYFYYFEAQDVNGSSATPTNSNVLYVVNSGGEYYIKGYIKDAGGDGIDKVEVYLRDSLGDVWGFARTSLSGYYEFKDLVSSSFTVTSLKPGWRFEPPSRTYCPLAVSQDNQDFTGLSTVNVSKGDVKIQGGEKGYVSPGEEAKIILNPAIPGEIKIRIYTLRGQLVWEKDIEVSETGEKVVRWAGKSGDKMVASGIYLVHIKGCGIDLKKKVAFIK